MRDDKGKPRSSLWHTPGIMEALRKHYDAELSHREIACALYDEFRIPLTRNAVLGKCNRMKWPARACDGKWRQRYPKVRERRNERARLKRASGFRLPSSSGMSRAGRMKAQREYMLAQGNLFPVESIPDEDTYSAPETRKMLSDLGPRECRWPYGDANYKFCGKPVKGIHGSYCEFHGLVHAYGSQAAAAFYCQAAQ
jgi:hypothetical protein